MMVNRNVERWIQYGFPFRLTLAGIHDRPCCLHLHDRPDRNLHRHYSHGGRQWLVTYGAGGGDVRLFSRLRDSADPCGVFVRPLWWQMGSGAGGAVLVIVHFAHAGFCRAWYYGAVGVSFSDGRGRGSHLAVDLFSLFALGAPGPSRVRRRADEFRYLGWCRYRIDLHTLANQCLVLAGGFLSLWRARHSLVCCMGASGPVTACRAT